MVHNRNIIRQLQEWSGKSMEGTQVKDCITVEKKGLKEEKFDRRKIKKVIIDAKKEAHEKFAAEPMVEKITERIFGMNLDNGVISSESIFSILIEELKANGFERTANLIISRADERENRRIVKTKLFRNIKDITSTDASDMESKRDNSNSDGDSPMGMMLKIAETVQKEISLWDGYPEYIAKRHRDGWIYIHDLGFNDETFNCCQIGGDVIKGGFNIGHGMLREAKNIEVATQHMSILLQSNQNDMFGGQSFPTFDYDLAYFVSKTHIRNIVDIAKGKLGLEEEDCREIFDRLMEVMIPNYDIETVMGYENDSKVKHEIREYLERYSIEYIEADLILILQEAYDKTEKDTHQAMEAFIANMNSMHSRAGNQVPFSSINYGTCTSREGRMIIRGLLESTYEGLGNGEIAIFPIHIFKMSEEKNIAKGSPNRDLFELACKVNAKAMYPNFLNLDAPYNKELYVPGHKETEMATMGCRTRVGKNIYNPERQQVTGRGNISFTTINIVKCAIESKRNLDKFYELLKENLDIVHEQLLIRAKNIGKKTCKNFKNLLGNNVWVDADTLDVDEPCERVLMNGSLTFGFIGLAETLTYLTGHHHGESEKAQKLGLEIVKFMRDYADKCSEQEKLNYTLIATPAEYLSGGFVARDKEKYGVIKGVTDKLYYTNSFHIPVSFKIGAIKKINIEAPYHELCNGGHITYVEMNGDVEKNVNAVIKIAEHMHKVNIGYGAINHEVDRDPICKYVGIIGDVCPRCGRREGYPMTPEKWHEVKRLAMNRTFRDTGYRGSMLEEKDRINNQV